MQTTSYLTMTLFCIVCAQIVFVSFVDASVSTNVVVSTYNVWNVMFNWDIRKLRIAKMIRSNNPDVIALQEIRCSNTGDENQIQELQNQLPRYKYLFFKCPNKVQLPKHAIHRNKDREGIGILSKLQILSAKTIQLPFIYGPDTNKRILLHVKLLKDDKMLNVINVHFSYDRQQQCRNAAAVLNYVFSNRMKNVIILGDFNTYNDFENPLELLTLKWGQEKTLTKCLEEHGNLGHRSTYFVDAWVQSFAQTRLGLTFSNMPAPGMESRPDRILINSDFIVIDSSLHGHGAVYRKQFGTSIYLHRLSTVIHHAKLLYQSVKPVRGYSCQHDCGPHGSCRCGVCVSGGNDKNCYLPDCEECSADIYRNYSIFCYIFVFLVIHLFFAVLSIFITAANFKGEAIFSILGFKCCLCNPDLYRKPIVLARRSTLLKICYKWPLFRLPACYLLMTSIVLLTFVNLYAKSVFTDSVLTVSSILDEEYFPSDHLFLTATLKLIEK